jgi:hypothetical protein
MLINIRVSELISDTNNNIPLALIVILSFFIPINDILPTSENKLDKYELIDKSDAQILYVSSNN